MTTGSAPTVVLTNDVPMLNDGDWVVVSGEPGIAFIERGSYGRIYEGAGSAKIVDFEPDSLSELWRRHKCNDCLWAVAPTVLTLMTDMTRRDELASRERQRIFDSKMRGNMTDARTVRRTRRKFIQGEHWGEAIRNAIAYATEFGSLDFGVLEVLNDMKHRVADSVFDTVVPKLDPTNQLLACNDCGSYELREDAVFVAGGDRICRVCVDDHYHYSECRDMYIHEDDVCHIYYSVSAYNRGIADDYCTESGYGNLYSYDGYFMDYDTYREVSGEYDDYDDDEEDSDGLRDYHSSDRYFSEENETPHVPALGVELEVYSEHRRKSVYAAKNVTSDWYFEHDGSLDDDYGFEIISQPYGPLEWPEQAKSVLDALTKSGAVAYTQPDDDACYGIHVNVHRRSLSRLQEARMLMFLLDDTNLDFVRAIAQRNAIYGGNSINFGSVKKATVRNVGGFNNDMRPYSLGKYSPLNLHDNLAEFRIFQSTLYYPSFMKNLEFVWALIEWTNVKSATGCSTNHLDFVKWLGASPARERQYPNLMAFLRKPSYMGKQYHERIYNSWNHLLPKQTTKSLDVVSGEPDLRLAA